LNVPPLEDFPALPGETWDAKRKRWRETFKGRIKGRPLLKVAQSLKDGIDYREDLARSPKDRPIDPATGKPMLKDPEAFVSGPHSLRRLIDKRKRQGWRQRKESWDDIERTIPDEKVNDRKLLMDAYGEACDAVNRGDA
jgi:hypothetical protein